MDVHNPRDAIQWLQHLGQFPRNGLPLTRAKAIPRATALHAASPPSSQPFACCKPRQRCLGITDLGRFSRFPPCHMLSDNSCAWPAAVFRGAVTPTGKITACLFVRRWTPQPTIWQKADRDVHCSIYPGACISSYSCACNL